MLGVMEHSHQYPYLQTVHVHAAAGASWCQPQPRLDFKSEKACNHISRVQCGCRDPTVMLLRTPLTLYIALPGGCVQCRL